MKVVAPRDIVATSLPVLYSLNATMCKTGAVEVASRDARALVPEVMWARQKSVKPESVMRQGLIKKHEADMLPQEEALAELLRGMLVRVLPPSLYLGARACAPLSTNL